MFHVVYEFQSLFSSRLKFKQRKPIWFVMGEDFSSLFIIWLLIFINGSALGPGTFSDVGDRECKSKLKSNSHSINSFLRTWHSLCQAIFFIAQFMHNWQGVPRIAGYDILASSLMGKWLCFKGLSTCICQPLAVAYVLSLVILMPKGNSCI